MPLILRPHPGGPHVLLPPHNSVFPGVPEAKICALALIDLGCVDPALAGTKIPRILRPNWRRVRSGRRCDSALASRIGFRETRLQRRKAPFSLGRCGPTGPMKRCTCTTNLHVNGCITPVSSPEKSSMWACLWSLSLSAHGIPEIRLPLPFGRWLAGEQVLQLTEGPAWCDADGDPKQQPW